MVRRNGEHSRSKPAASWNGILKRPFFILALSRRIIFDMAVCRFAGKGKAHFAVAQCPSAKDEAKDSGRECIKNDFPKRPPYRTFN